MNHNFEGTASELQASCNRALKLWVVSIVIGIIALVTTWFAFDQSGQKNAIQASFKNTVELIDPTMVEPSGHAGDVLKDHLIKIETRLKRLENPLESSSEKPALSSPSITVADIDGRLAKVEVTLVSDAKLRSRLMQLLESVAPTGKDDGIPSFRPSNELASANKQDPMARLILWLTAVDKYVEDTKKQFMEFQRTPNMLECRWVEGLTVVATDVQPSDADWRTVFEEKLLTKINAAIEGLPRSVFISGQSAERKGKPLVLVWERSNPGNPATLDVLRKDASMSAKIRSGATQTGAVGTNAIYSAINPFLTSLDFKVAFLITRSEGGS